MKMRFDARDYGYTIVSRLEEILRERCIENLEIFDGKMDEVIPQGVIAAAQKRNETISNIETLMENIDFIHLKEILLYRQNYLVLVSKWVGRPHKSVLSDS